MHSGLLRDLEKLLGSSSVLFQPEDVLLYEYDGSVEKGRPDMVVFPTTTQEVSRIVKLAVKHDVPIVGRGAGTGLSGGALARGGGIMIAFGRMNRILELDLQNRRAVVQPGVVNFDLTRAVEHAGLYYAPDPSSQKSCTIGGNVSENSGGPHTLAYGVTTNHVTGLGGHAIGQGMRPSGIFGDVATDGARFLAPSVATSPKIPEGRIPWLMA